MNLVPARTPVSFKARTPSDFKQMLWEHCFHYLLDRSQVPDALVMFRFHNGDWLMVRRPDKAGQGFSVEFPKLGVNSSPCPLSETLSQIAADPGFDWSSRSVKRIGATCSGPERTRVEVFLLVVPLPAGASIAFSEEIHVPLRVPESELRLMVESSEVTDATTLAAYALFLTKQSLQTPLSTCPVVDRRTPKLKAVGRTPAPFK